MPVDWGKLESMLTAYGLDNLAADAHRYGRESDLRRDMDKTELQMQKQQFQQIIQQLREGIKDSKEDQEASGQGPRVDSKKRAVRVRFSDLPSDVQEFVDVMVRQAELGTLYTMDGETHRGAHYQCTASMYEERFNTGEERYVVLLLETERAAGKVTVAYRKQGSFWQRIGD